MCVSPSPEPSNAVVGWIFLVGNCGLVCLGVSECPELFQCTSEVLIHCTFCFSRLLLMQYIQYKCSISSIQGRNEMEDVIDPALKAVLAVGDSSSLNQFNQAEHWK